MEGSERRRLEIHGRVQGVGYRFWVLRHARTLGLHGVVRNRGDGAVELEVAGPASALDRLERLLEEGPALARVDAVRRVRPGSEPLPSPFDIAG